MLFTLTHHNGWGTTFPDGVSIDISNARAIPAGRWVAVDSNDIPDEFMAYMTGLGYDYRVDLPGRHQGKCREWIMLCAKHRREGTIELFLEMYVNGKCCDIYECEVKYDR